MNSPIFSLRNLTINRTGQKILDISSLDVQNGEILSIIGPNGAGKTSLMMAVCGLLPADSGEFFFKGKPVIPHKDLHFRRRLALVMQAPLLLHASVYDNIATGLRFRRYGQAESNHRIENWLKKLSIEDLRNRRAEKLSGGEAQRVSLARAFVLDPELLLLDEPFSALDAPTRMRLLNELKLILTANQTTTLFITHDLNESLMMADRIAVLMEGQIRQVGKPVEVFRSPADPDVARFTGIESILPGEVTEQKEGLAIVKCDQCNLQVITGNPVGSKVYICLRPEDITLSISENQGLTSARNQFEGWVKEWTPQGALMRVAVDGPLPLAALITRVSFMEMNLSIGQKIQVSFKASAAHVITRSTST